MFHNIEIAKILDTGDCSSINADYLSRYISSDNLKKVDNPTKFLVIGGIGFVGIHVVEQLLDSPEHEVAILDTAASEAALLAQAERYEIDVIASNLSRIRLINSDVTKDKMGLNDHEFDEMSEYHRVVFCAGPSAEYWHLDNGIELCEKWVPAILHTLSFCTSNVLKPLTFLSTFDSFWYDDPQFLSHPDTKAFDGTTKMFWLIESLLDAINPDVLQVTSVRAPIVFGTTERGINKHSINLGWLMIRCISDMGFGWEGLYFPFIPADLIAKDIVEYIQSDNYRSKLISFYTLTGKDIQQQQDIRLYPFAEFQEHLKNTHIDDEDQHVVEIMQKLDPRYLEGLFQPYDGMSSQSDQIPQWIRLYLEKN